MLRRSFLNLPLSACVLSVIGSATRADEPTAITVYKTPACGCCAKWADYLSAEGFAVTIVDEPDLSGTKRRYGVPVGVQSCHTAVVEGYIIEGHVPVSDIRRVLAQRPAIKGLAAPGMPFNSPGMNSIEPRGYDVVSFTTDGRVELFTRY